MKKVKKKRKKGTFIKILEYTGVYILILITRVVPLRVVRIVSNVLGDLLYFLVPKRRTIALDNLRNALQEKNEQEIQGIARQCCRSFFLTFLEIIKLRFIITESGAVHSIMSKTENANTLFEKARKIHDSAKGCIFVTPHIGSWELLPHISSLAGIPLVIVVRPLDNEYLEKLIYTNRASSGQLIIPKKNALYFLQKTLKQGKSVGMLPDQSTMKGISVDFFGRNATTTPIPAILGIRYKKPIVVVACCRDPDDNHYKGIVSDPIWPGEYKIEKMEIFRLTEAMNREMETIIRKFPEQYLWIHNRWKTYKGKKEFLA
jgi:KDO2-lipid IV(A) lauroyltransferase